ncbi:protein NRT1/ PTR FAMILY 5.2-like [Diospyros lotus]|uniref:protein NRT1/ PTR FAMILY 5.2-like n=1 Tax=Diospyros lotus TaxID=55363 RepID=UPI00224FFA68|nr:protein NRT1/ PTR FAMILY 5.2-like [Diospyros lotus]
MLAEEAGSDDHTEDGTVDLKGNPVRRSERGQWRACKFIAVYELFERMAYQVLSSSLMIYLTKRLHRDTVSAANVVTNWVGTVYITPIIGAYVADAHLGRYWTFLIASAIYLFGMSILTLAVSVPGIKPPQCSAAAVQSGDCKKASTLQLAVFYGALYTLAIGTGGTKANISTIGADQFDEFEPKEKDQKLSFFNRWMSITYTGTLFANTVLVYIQDNGGWTLGYGLPTAGLAVPILIFLAGTPFYRHRVPTGSPFTRMAKVIVAAARKWKVQVPGDSKELIELKLEEYAKKGKFRIDYTPTLRFLNKASVRTGPTSPWMLCSVTQVEETKQMLRMIPILVATFVPSTMIAQISTLFVKQGTTLDGNVGGFKIPPANLTGFVTISTIVCMVIYDRYFVKMTKKWTKNPRGISMLQRMGIGFVLTIIVMLIACLTERYRLKVAKDHGVVASGGQVPLTIFILLPQFVLMGTANAFLDPVRTEFFYDQAPESMKSLGTSYAMITVGVGNFLSSFLLSTVAHITEKHGHRGWILNNLNASHLDYYYAFFCILNILNFVFFLVVTKYYVYKAEVSPSMEVLRQELGGPPQTVPVQPQPAGS